MTGGRGGRGKQLLDDLNPLNAELNPICHLLALVGAHHIVHVSRVRVKERVGCGNGKRKMTGRRERRRKQLTL